MNLKVLLILVLFVFGLYLLICTLLYAFQESIIFFPQKLRQDHAFQFNWPHEEKNITMKDGTVLNGLLFKADSSKGVILYLHGNGGTLDTWGWVARTYTDLHYDVFMLDYRGYGKSGGHINSETQLHNDVQTVYDMLAKEYTQDRIIVLGYSLGTGLASKVASANKPNLLILQAPYYNAIEEMKQRFPFVPTFVLRYKFETNKNLKKCAMPVIIFHGDRDGVIDYRASVKLQQEFKPGDQLITLTGEGHNGMRDTEEYRVAIGKILGNP
jgi:alpha-beta hydrolase superfamily lysophospholipase